MGQMAFAYFAYRAVRRGSLPTWTFVFLGVGAMFPALANEGLLKWRILGIDHLWSYSLLAPVALWGLYSVARLAPPLRQTSNIILPFTFAYTTHLLITPALDLFQLYFSVLTTDIGASWLFPFYQITIREPRLDPGFYLLPWQLLAEGIAFAFASLHWIRSSPTNGVAHFNRTRLWAPSVLGVIGLIAAAYVLALYPAPQG